MVPAGSPITLCAVSLATYCNVQMCSRNFKLGLSPLVRHTNRLREGIKDFYLQGMRECNEFRPRSFRTGSSRSFIIVGQTPSGLVFILSDLCDHR